MSHVKPAVQITFGLVLLTASLLMGADMLGLIPDPYGERLQSRRQICEFIAIHGSAALQEDAVGLLESTLQAVVERNTEVRSIVLRTRDGRIVAEAGEKVALVTPRTDESSTQTRIWVPIFKDQTRWGTLEVHFTPIYPEGFWVFWSQPVVRLVAFIVPLSFLSFLLLMRRALHYLDPNSVIPPRVKSTLDTLSEGVVLLDNQERIVLANAAFANKVGRSDEMLTGKKASLLGWSLAGTERGDDTLPWRRVMNEKRVQKGVKLCLRTEGALQTFMVNGAPILDGKGGMRGVLATFDDVTQIEEQNEELQNMLQALEESHEKVRLQNQKLEILATKDPLTLCFNRRAFMEMLETEFSKAQRYDTSLSCVMVDIDHFKTINDTYGHQKGDEVLQMVAKVLQTTGRKSDVVCRYGGEEFNILLPNISIDSALKAAERYRSAIEDADCEGITVTASLGVSAVELGCENPHELLVQADKALYAAKNSGRNRVVSWGDKNALNPEGDADADAFTHIPQHIVNALILALANRDLATAEHSRQVGDLCVAAAQGLMSFNEILVLEVAGQLHDIGKLGVPDSILLKGGALSQEEWRIMGDHRKKSVDVIASIFLSPDLVEIVRNHSAWYGGSPFNPDLPKGKEIPLGSRILSIADAFSSMTSYRPYREAMSFVEAYRELRRCAGTQFDPFLVEHFIQVMQNRDESRKSTSTLASSEAKLDIGCEIEKLFIAVNTSAFGALSTITERLIAKAERYGFTRICEMATQIKEASDQRRDLMTILGLAADLMKAYGSKEFYKPETVEFRKAS